MKKIVYVAIAMLFLSTAFSGCVKDPITIKPEDVGTKTAPINPFDTTKKFVLPSQTPSQLDSEEVTEKDDEMKIIWIEVVQYDTNEFYVCCPNGSTIPQRMNEYDDNETIYVEDSLVISYHCFAPEIHYDKNSGVLTATVKNDYKGDIFVAMTLKGPQDQVWNAEGLNLKPGETKEFRFRPKESGNMTLRAFVDGPNGVKAPEKVDFTIQIN